MSRGGVGAPITRQRSEWREGAHTLRSTPRMELVGTWKRNVNDGTLRAIHSIDDGLHHLSVSFVDHRGRPSRYPRWDELTEARYRFLPHAIDVVMHLPPPGEYVALHDSTFHLHEDTGEGAGTIRALRAEVAELRRKMDNLHPDRIRVPLDAALLRKGDDQ